MLACRVDNRGIESMRVYRASPEIGIRRRFFRSKPGNRLWTGSKGFNPENRVDRGPTGQPDLGRNRKSGDHVQNSFQPELPTRPVAPKMSPRRTWATFEAIGKIIGAMLGMVRRSVEENDITVNYPLISRIRLREGDAWSGLSGLGRYRAGRSRKNLYRYGTMFITKMARCTVGASRCARTARTCSKPRRLR